MTDKLSADALELSNLSGWRLTANNVTVGPDEFFGLSIKYHQTMELCGIYVAPGRQFPGIVIELLVRRPQRFNGNIAMGGSMLMSRVHC